MKRIIALILCIILCLCLIPIGYAGSDQTVIIMPGIPLPMIIIDLTTGHRIITTPSYTQEITETTDSTAEKINETVGTTTTDTPIYTADNTLAQQIFELTNAERESHNLAPLTYSERLQEAANIRAQEISENFSHTRPDGSSCHSVVPQDYNVAGENLIMATAGYNDAETLMETWMNSEGHRANILLVAFTEIAIGVYIKDDVTYVTQIFLG